MHSESQKFNSNPGTPSSSKSRINSGFQDFVVHSLTRIEKQLQLQSEMISKLTDVDAAEGTNKKATIKVKFGFPLSSMNEVDDMESKLKETNGEFRKSLVRHFASIGRITVNDVVSRICYHAICDDLANNFAWKGIRKINPKRSFEQLELKSVMFEAIQRTIKSAKEFEMSKKIASWLQHAGDRIKVKETRLKGLTAEDDNIEDLF